MDKIDKEINGSQESGYTPTGVLDKNKILKRESAVPPVDTSHHLTIDELTTPHLEGIPSYPSYYKPYKPFNVFDIFKEVDLEKIDKIISNHQENKEKLKSLKEEIKIIRSLTYDIQTKLNDMMCSVDEIEGKL